MIDVIIPQKKGERIFWTQLFGSSQCLSIVELAKKYQGLVVVFSPDIASLSSIAYELRFFAKDSIEILTFPDWETLPYDRFSPHQDIISQRLLTLYKLLSLNKGILVLSLTSAMYRLPPKEYIATSNLVLRVGEVINLVDLRNNLQKNSYRNVEQVMAHGEFAIRGSIIDIFPSGSPLPYRIDFFDNEIDSIRAFNPDDQRSLQPVENLDFLPAREFSLGNIKIFQQRWEEIFSTKNQDNIVYENIQKGIAVSGMEYYLPLFFAQTQTIFQYFSRDALIVHLGDPIKVAEGFWQEINVRYEQYRHDRAYPILPPSEIFLPVHELFGYHKEFSQIYISDTCAEKGKIACIDQLTKPLPDLSINHKDEPLRNLKEFIATKTRILFVAESAGRKEALLTLLARANIHPENCTWQEFLNANFVFGITIAWLDRGLWLDNLAIIPEALLFGQQVMQRRRREATKQDTQSVIHNLVELQIGDPVVHVDYGIGKYLGLQTIATSGQDTEYLTIEYANEAKLYVPISALHLISRYLGANQESVVYNHLGSKQWEKVKRKAIEKVHDVAAELLDIHARRALASGYKFPVSTRDYQDFANSFPFETTLDQQKAIDDVISDMTSSRCMDRLVCGDVGFGKTEVAMRAAFIAIQAGKQVVVLVPTTILGQQHYDSFKDRFSNWPVTIGLLSRFTPEKEQKKIIQGLKEGAVDIAIGTHKLLQGDIQFKNLGLLIIDEEHRFGVKQKEKIKSLRANIDILALTATPIPRTLSMALASIRDLSIIATPPAKRLAIKTFVRERNRQLIREAILREIMRGGQVYFLHNDIKTIERTAGEIRALMPEAKALVGHAQLKEHQLEQIMRDFYHQRFNVLVCTTIIESGIDIPTANTIIIDHADRFGLSQLHQLRGRVGRSHHQAYAYLLISSHQSLTKDALKRLDAISGMEELGAGFSLAIHDLEIRGAGEILGEEQSGQIQEIGFNLYLEFLEQAVKALQSGNKIDLENIARFGVEAEIAVPALIPDSYLHDVNLRLILYKRIASSDEAGLRDIQIEMIDRFGLLPQATKNLFAIAELKLKAARLGVRKVKASKNYGFFEFDEQPKIDPRKVINLMQKFPKQYKLEGPHRFRFVLSEEADKQLQQIDDLLNAFM